MKNKTNTFKNKLYEFVICWTVMHSKGTYLDCERAHIQTRKLHKVLPYKKTLSLHSR